jgi:D-beta-D-heptose 7-phosphate kinase / D-beta-D-heptose 1-phosphate adenosyltransferase
LPSGCGPEFSLSKVSGGLHVPPSRRAGTGAASLPHPPRARLSGLDTLLQHLARWKAFTALVVGDFMLDQLHYGDAERLSADAPVPVLHIRRTEDRPGGAANVCLDLVAMRGRVKALGIIGDDHEGHLLARALQAQHVEPAALISDPSRPTTVKRNLIGLAQARHPQKMFRCDFESREPLAPHLAAQLIAAFEKSLPGTDVVCIEDYNKGVCTPEVCQAVIRAARAAGIPVLVDPARIADYSKYAGATAITPNRNEAELATGCPTDGQACPEHNARLARILLDTLDLQAVVLTLDRHGALLLERRTPEHRATALPTIAREVYDVTGAGDMMLAALAAARANGIAWPDAVRFANAAAGLEVEVFGVMPMPLEKIHHELLLRAGGLDGKLRTLDQVLVQVAACRREGRRVVFTNGCFDILHSGHIALLEKAAALADFLIVAINSDESVRRLKGSARPVNNEIDRARVLGALAGVGAVVIFSEETPLRLIEAIRPDVLVKGADYTRDNVVGAEIVESSGGKVVLIDLVEGRSTTETIEKLRRG